MKTVRRPPYPKWNPGYFPCSSLTPLPLSSRRPSVSFGGFGLSRWRFFERVGERVRYLQAERVSHLHLVMRISRDSPDQTNFPGYSSFWDTVKYNPAFQGRQMRPDSLKFPVFI